MLRPVCLLLLLVFSIYSSDLQFQNLLLNCDMPCLFPSCLVYVVRYASGGCLEMSKSLPVGPIWSGFLAQLPPFSCVGFTVTGLLNLWSDCATHKTVTVCGEIVPPPPDRHIQVLYPGLLTRLRLALILRTALFLLPSKEVTEAIQGTGIDRGPSDVFCIPSGEIRTDPATTTKRRGVSDKHHVP